MFAAWNDARMNTKGIFRLLLAAVLLWLMAAPLVRAQEAPPTTPEAPSAQEAPQPHPMPRPRRKSLHLRNSRSRLHNKSSHRNWRPETRGSRCRTRFRSHWLPNGGWSTRARRAHRRGSAATRLHFICRLCWRSRIATKVPSCNSPLPIIRCWATTPTGSIRRCTRPADRE